MASYRLNHTAAALCALFLAASSAVSASAQDLKPALSSASAKAIVAGCEAFALEAGLKVNITVMDQGRNLMAFLRMDGAPLGSIDIANWKANSSASFARATKGSAERAKEFPALGHAPNIAIFEGGEAIFTEAGGHLGAIGVSGATGAEDAQCGRAGIKAAGLKSTR